MSQILVILHGSGSYDYNRRVPKHPVHPYGSFIALALSYDPVDAAVYAKRRDNLLKVRSII